MVRKLKYPPQTQMTVPRYGKESRPQTSEKWVGVGGIRDAQLCDSRLPDEAGGPPLKGEQG